jgi:hypothetical protein
MSESSFEIPIKINWQSVKYDGVHMFFIPELIPQSTILINRYEYELKMIQPLKTLSQSDITNEYILIATELSNIYKNRADYKVELCYTLYEHNYSIIRHNSLVIRLNKKLEEYDLKYNIDHSKIPQEHGTHFFRLR